MFKLIVVLAAVLAMAFAAAKPQVITSYTSGLAASPVVYSSPVAYSGYSGVVSPVVSYGSYGHLPVAYSGVYGAGHHYYY